GGGLLFSETRSNVNDLIPSEVGGNGYAWFTTIDVTGGIAIDSTQLSVVPEPSVVLGMLTSGVLGLLIVRRRR
ncbi:MAG: PEP-CTERM sorting domain-containing protein, partial [Verrucomicrobiota bacterium]